MIAPDRGRVELDLHDDKPPLLLWYPNGALAALEEKLGVSIEYAESLRWCRDLLRPSTLSVFIWAGRLWQEPELRHDSLRTRVGFAPRVQTEVVATVRRALILGLSGRDVDDDEPTETLPDPQAPALLNGAGVESSEKPSAK